jgi:murein DD-endopeptidase
MIRWNKIMECEQKRFEEMSESDRFIYFLLLQFGSPYGWGEENPRASDCSGAVCMALYAATGLLIRTTADDLFNRVFTRVNPRKGDIRAVFYRTKKTKQHGDRTAFAGSVVHIAGILDDGVILNSQEPHAEVRKLSDVSDSFLRQGHEVFIRGLDRTALEKMARDGKSRYGLDTTFKEYFEVRTDL